MTTEQILETGFLQAFIEEYFEFHFYNYYQDKDRLLYILCGNEEEKKKVTIEQINHTKVKISELGFEGLSFAYLKSGKKESHDYIPKNRHEFWVRQFAFDCENNITTFKPISKALGSYNDVEELTEECFMTEDEFWEFYPNSQKPKIPDLITIIPNEIELVAQIEFEIENYNENEYWEFDFEEYQKYIPISKPIELLFNLCELLVQLNRLEMFKSFLDINNLPPKLIEKHKPELTINQIALKYAYSEKQITRKNGDEIAEQHGHNSGEKLFQRFTYYLSQANRKGKPIPCTPKKLNNKINLINSVIDLLPTDKQERAKDEVSILKKIYEAEYQ